MPALPIRIAILECDTPLPNTKARFGGYGGVFEFLLKRGARALGPDVLDPERDLKITKHHIEGDEVVEKGADAVYPDLDAIDAILITGSRHDSFTSPPWIMTLVEYTRRALAHPHVRVIGVCFGHQIVGRAMGAPVGRNEKGWEAAVNQVTLTEKGKELFGRETLEIHQMHRDIIQSLPPHLTTTSSSASTPVTILGSSPTCDIQGLFSPHHPALLTIQGHPEFTEEIMSEILATRHKSGIFDDEAYTRYKGREGDRHDGVVVAGAFLRFLMESED